VRSKSAAPAKPCYLSPRLLREIELPEPLRPVGARIARTRRIPGLAAPLVVAFASELILGTRPETPARDARYLVLSDVPEPALMRVPAALQMRRPDYRLYVTGDRGVLRRLIVASLRADPRLGIVDAYTLGGELVVLGGDFEIRSFPLAEIPAVGSLAPDEQAGFDVDDDGSFLYWPAGGLHLGTSQLLQAFDPMFLADIEIERNTNDRTGAALRAMREEKRLRQSDVEGLSERQVRRIEEGISRLRPASAERFAAAFGMSTSQLLAEVGRRAVAMKSA
jgi:hypothetical protein